jgi:DHA1 family multidrug resistance protein-like MFS transporter
MLQLSPLSNLPSIGRSPVYVLGSLAFCLINIGTALAKNVSTILVLRFIGGFVGSAPISVGGATLMEIYGPPEVPYAIAFYAVSGVCGPILGPVSPLSYPPSCFTLTSIDLWNLGDVCDKHQSCLGTRADLV